MNIETLQKVADEMIDRLKHNIEFGITTTEQIFILFYFKTENVV